MLSSKPCIATCVIDGVAVTLNYYPDTQDLRISNAYGACIYRTKWLAPWPALHAAMRELARSKEASLDAAASLLSGSAAPSLQAAGVASDVTAVAP
ncbi:hypothetical protein BTO02_24930 [Paraburkholderia sp. SOS3]|nr:hypothetical protein BTO02_24930 [Paraburkholderia sp. SOS3]